MLKGGVVAKSKDYHQSRLPQIVCLFLLFFVFVYEELNQAQVNQFVLFVKESFEHKFAN